MLASDFVKNSLFLFQVQEMTTLIRKAFISNLDSADWMDNRTKKAAKEKVGLNIYTQKKFAWISVSPKYFYLPLRLLETSF